MMLAIASLEAHVITFCKNIPQTHQLQAVCKQMHLNSMKKSIELLSLHNDYHFKNKILAEVNL